MEKGAHSWLWPGEDIVYWARQSCWGALKLALITAATAALVQSGFDVFGGDDTPLIVVVGAVGTGMSFGVPHFLTSYRRFELVLTSHRVFYRKGLIWRKTGEFPVAEITDIEGGSAGDHPFELKLAGGESLNIHGLPDLGRLRETFAKAIGAA